MLVPSASSAADPEARGQRRVARGRRRESPIRLSNSPLRGGRHSAVAAGIGPSLLDESTKRGTFTSQGEPASRVNRCQSLVALSLGFVA